ncbi:hypothetical protein [Lacimonas salitolerans]|uniref:Ribbon-helix-helix protein, copG family n=1 Tax=Lacimonas salitolerans TaxID=1323750 RepID=A0ABW4EEC8_9RHOB
MSKKHGEKKGEGKSGNKDSQLILRLDKDERDAFVALCKEMDTSAAREIRGFIRQFLKTNS